LDTWLCADQRAGLREVFLAGSKILHTTKQDPGWSKLQSLTLLLDMDTEIKKTFRIFVNSLFVCSHHLSESEMCEKQTW